MDLPSLTRLARDPDVWLADGNVVVIAEATAFRVHESVLSRRSMVFGNMCSGAHSDSVDPLEGLDDIRDCIVLRVSDTVYDMKTLLCFMYDCLE